MCTAYEVTYKSDKNLSMTCWITNKPLAFHHDIVPFMTMYSADKIGFKKSKKPWRFRNEFKKWNRNSSIYRYKYSTQQQIGFI
ncbi:MAG: hypothetical protein HC798_03430 [Polaribacter sp.]|nr:hypothetical protein [Polaribacter sp.]